MATSPLSADPGLAPPPGLVDDGDSRPSSARGRRLPAQALALGLLGAALLVAVLEIVSRAGLVNERYLPPFSTVLVATVRLFGDATFLSDVLSTVLTWGVGLGLSILVGVPIGILLGLSEVGYRASRTVIELVRTMPAVALIPLVILVAGNGLGMKLIVAVYAAMWPILFNAYYGVHGTDPKAKEMGRSFGLSRVAIVRRIVIPSAAPFIATGVRISSSIVLIVIITVELIAGGAEGLGAFIMRQQILGDQQTLVYAGILVTGLLGLAINTTLGAVERRLFRWNTTARK